jgi:oxygen-independent coproporphyrinogen-3 oxidase
LGDDLAAQAPSVTGREVVSIFMGGGTPSLFAPASIATVLAKTREHYSIAADVEITLEANPGTIERGRFAEYRAAGVNRVSLGAQSFDAEQLHKLGRIHAADDTRRAAEELHATGLENFNIDLMYGLPGQQLTQALTDMREALALMPSHLSHYQLSIEPGTAFAAAPPVLPVDESIDAMLEVCTEALNAQGFQQYEVSGYAQPTRECRHNLNYWQFGDYLGVGAGAHGKITRRGSGLTEDLTTKPAEEVLIERTTQLREPRRYLAAGPAGVTRKVVAAIDRPFEYAMNALRLRQGFRAEDFCARTGLTLEAIESPLNQALARGWIEEPKPGHWRCTRLGLRFLNEVLQHFLPRDVSARR